MITKTTMFGHGVCTPSVTALCRSVRAASVADQAVLHTLIPAPHPHVPHGAPLPVLSGAPPGAVQADVRCRGAVQEQQGSPGAGAGGRSPHHAHFLQPQLAGIVARTRLVVVLHVQPCLLGVFGRRCCLWGGLYVSAVPLCRMCGHVEIRAEHLAVSRKGCTNPESWNGRTQVLLG